MYINKALLSNVVYSLINSMVCSFTYSLNIHKVKSESEVTQSCPTLCDAMDCSLPGSSVHGTFQAKVLEWVAISLSRGSSQPRDRIQVSLIVGRRFTVLSLFLKEMNIYVHKKNIQKKVHSGTLLNLFKLETTQTSINRE